MGALCCLLPLGAALLGGVPAQALPAQAVEPAQKLLAAPVALFDAAHRVTFPGLVPPIEQRTDAANGVEGYLFRPAGHGPAPAVVLMPGCHGLQRFVGYRRWVDRLVSWGYVVLAVDSLTPRHTTYCFIENKVDRPTAAGDAYGALRHLAAQPFVQGDRVAAIGYSFGANALLTGLETETDSRAQRLLALDYPALRPLQFRAAVAFYPTQFSPHQRFSAPLLLLGGDQDRWDTAFRLWGMQESQRRLGDPTLLHVYLFATHGFDMETEMAGGEIEMHYDPKATADAAERVKAFLERNLREEMANSNY